MAIKGNEMLFANLFSTLRIAPDWSMDPIHGHPPPLGKVHTEEAEAQRRSRNADGKEFQIEEQLDRRRCH